MRINFWFTLMNQNILLKLFRGRVSKHITFFLVLTFSSIYSKFESCLVFL